MKQRTASQQSWHTLAGEIADQLGEKETKPRRQIEAIAQYAGIEFTRHLLQEAQAVESNGGMILPDQSRRRTLGGIFFHLARAQLPDNVKKSIFESEAMRSNPPRPPAFRWEERSSILETLLQEQGVVSTVKVTLIGRPGRLEIRNNLVITTLSHFARFPNLPRGLPSPPAAPTLYTVYISLKQWRRVEAALSDPDDLLIVEGVCAFDPQIRAIAIFTTSLTTRATEMNRRDAQRQSTTKDFEETNAEVSPKVGSLPKEAIQQASITQPSDVVGRLSELYTSASVLRQKIRTLQGKPEGQQPGLEMTQKLLTSIENQIAELEKKDS